MRLEFEFGDHVHRPSTGRRLRRRKRAKCRSMGAGRGLESRAAESVATGAGAGAGAGVSGKEPPAAATCALRRRSGGPARARLPGRVTLRRDCAV